MHEHRFHGEPDRLRAPERVVLLEVDRVVQLTLEGITAGTILDVGTGTGVFAEAFAKKGFAVTGIDANQEMLDAARRHVSAGQFQQALAEELPFLEGSFDVVFLGLVLHETDIPLKALKEAKRVARQRVAMVEWPYRLEDHGPPLEERIRPETVARLVHHSGFPGFERILLQNVDFYRLNV
ncbi:MAG: class I SAM-dependent methyltransferase [Bacteroidota bacterium]|jgi:ubiquinone/menaquinone biosynthesis C-methylase UbiE